MNYKLPVVECLGDDKFSSLGEFEFQLCPKVGEIVQVAGPIGELLFMEVVRIEHAPAGLPKNKMTREPRTTLYVKYESMFNG